MCLEDFILEKISGVRLWGYKMKKIYSGKYEDFSWVGFGSGSGTNLRECAKVIKPALIFSDRPKAKLLQLEEFTDVPKIVLDGYKICGSWKKGSIILWMIIRHALTYLRQGITFRFILQTSFILKNLIMFLFWHGGIMSRL